MARQTLLTFVNLAASFSLQVPVDFAFQDRVMLI
jgi:hypothetical protein